MQFYSTNPRNSAINIRGLGAPFGLTNDGLEPGVGLYIDGVFYAARVGDARLPRRRADRSAPRSAGHALRQEHHGRRDQRHDTQAELHQGERLRAQRRRSRFRQAKASVTSPLGSKVAGRLSFSGTERGGSVYNTKTQKSVNDLDNAGIRGQLLIAPTDKLAILWAADYSRQRPEGYTQVVAGVAPTLRPANRQHPQIAADLGYAPPSFNPSIGSRTWIRRCAPTRISAARR